MILKRIHNISLEEADRPAKTKENHKMMQLDRYLHSTVRVPNDEAAILYIQQNINKIWRQPPVYMHGDYHPGNLIYTSDSQIGVIDFNRWEVGDPYEEFYKLESFGIEVSVPYCIGQIDAYFDDEVPEIFWETQAVYVAHASLYSIKWAEKFGAEAIDGMVKRWNASYENYEGFTRIVPKWYESVSRVCELPFSMSENRHASILPRGGMHKTHTASQFEKYQFAFVQTIPLGEGHPGYRI